MKAFVQLLSYISWVCTDETYDRFRETIRKRLPEAEDTVKDRIVALKLLPE